MEIDQKIVVFDSEIKHVRPVFLWDLHEVVFCKSWKQLLRVILTYEAKKAVLKQLPKNIISLYKKRMLNNKRKKSFSIVDLLYLAESENNKFLSDLIFRICCAYKPISQTVLIIKLLKEKGFVHHIGSNIARPVFDQFKELYPDIFSLFDYAHVVDVVSRDSVIQKPDPVFFNSYLQIQKLIPSEVIFIDNKKKNIKTAQNVGLRVIHFKRASQLKKELQHFKIIV